MSPLATMQRSTFLKVRKSRPRVVSTLGDYYILDTYKNVVVDTHFDTLAEAREARKNLKEKFPGNVNVLR